MARLKFLVLLLVATMVVTACGGGGGAAQPTAATSGGAPTEAPGSTAAAPEPTAAPEATAAPAAEATAAPAAEATAPAAEATAAPAAEATAAPAAELEVDKSKLSQTLNLYNWADYIEPAVLEDFEKEYGVKVAVDVFDSNEDMIGKVRPGNSGYDIVFPSDYAVDIMARENLLAKLDKSMLPNLKNIKPDLLDLYYDKGNVYSIPYNTGLTGLAYDKTQFDTTPDSWGVVFDPAQSEQLKGQFSMLDDAREVPGAAMKYLGKSLNGTDSADLAKVEEILKAQKASPKLSGYDSSNYGRQLASGQVVIAHAYNNAALQARMGLEGDEGFPGNPNVGFFIPKEGGTIWQDNMCILADSPNAYTAHVFINYMMRPDVAAKNEEYVLGLTPNAEAEKLLSPELQELFKEGFAPDAETLKRVEWIERNDKTSAYDELWTRVKGE
jgi:spermidine/putrescine transport system substrate-binding protein